MSKYLILVFPLLFTLNYPGATWDRIENRTWISATDGVFGAQMVFLKDAEGQKAINQWLGSGCCHILSHVYAVEISKDTIVLESLPGATTKDYGIPTPRKRSNLSSLKMILCSKKSDPLQSTPSTGLRLCSTRAAALFLVTNPFKKTQ